MRRSHYFCQFTLLLILGCSPTSPDDTAKSKGGGTTAGNAFIGELTHADNNPAPFAKVRVKKLSDQTQDSAYTVTTDEKGKYQFSNIDLGWYELQGSAVFKNDSVYLRRDSIYMPAEDTTVDLGIDTLRIRTGIFGVVRKPDTSDHSGLFVHVPGTGFLAISDTNGHFLMSNLPSDTGLGYRIKVLDPGGTYTAPEISNVKVHDLAVDTLKDTILLNFATFRLDTNLNLQVFPDEEWVESGITVEKGSSLEIIASGTVTSEDDSIYSPKSHTALGGNGYALINEHIYALYGKIGDAAVFEIGEYFFGIANATGELKFLINSQEDQDESGNYVVDSLRVTGPAF